MATPALNPFVLKDCLFQVAADNYEGHVSTVEFVPTSAVQAWKGLTPTAVYSAGTNSTWVCNLGLAQDWQTADSLSRYLFENEGEEVIVRFEPVNGGLGIDATIIIAPGTIGGAVDTFAVATVSLGVKGKPTLDAIVP
jgi:hypothetical protein